MAIGGPFGNNSALKGRNVIAWGNAPGISAEHQKKASPEGAQSALAMMIALRSR
jgi:hypothetical protein